MEDEKSGSSFTKSCLNATNAFLGIGILTVPYALSRGGWLSLIFFLLVALGSFYAGILLKRSMDIDSSICSYHDMAGRAFGKRGRITVAIVINLELYLICIGLLIMEGDNLHKLFPNLTMHLGSLIIDGIKTSIMITTLIILPTMLLTDLAILSYISATGILSCLIILVSVFCIGAFSGVGFESKGTLFDLRGLTTAVSLYIVCFAGHSVTPSIYTSMKRRIQFNKVLLVTFFVATLSYGPMAVVGYLMYGGNLRSQITLNLPTSSLASQVVIYTTLIIPITKYALMMTPVADAIETLLSKERKKRLAYTRRLIRLVLLFSNTVFACIFPHFEFVLSIIGSIFVVLGSFLLPCLCYMKISKCYKRCSVELFGIAAIVVFGGLFGVLGTYSSILNLVRKQ